MMSILTPARERIRGVARFRVPYSYTSGTSTYLKQLFYS